MDLAMAALDPDGDGQISFDEFARFWGEDGARQTTNHRTTQCLTCLCLVCVLTVVWRGREWRGPSGIDGGCTQDGWRYLATGCSEAGGSDSDDDEDADWSEDDLA